MTLRDKSFPELAQLEQIIAQLGDRAQVEIVEHIAYQGRQFPVYCITLGSRAPGRAGYRLFRRCAWPGENWLAGPAGVFANHCATAHWDKEFAARLEKSRLVFMPIVNPAGVFRGSRCNANGVDLMRNAPTEGVGKIKLYSGHRISPRLPWYRGEQTHMEKEALALCQSGAAANKPLPLDHCG